MKRLITGVAAGAMALGCLSLVGGLAAVNAGAQTTTTTTTSTTTTTVPPFVNGNKYMSVSVDTVVGAGSPAASVTSGGCALENVFGQGATIVFRMWGIDNTTGLPLVGTPGVGANVSSVTIEDLPGVATPPTMSYSPRDGYWTYGWFTSASTPVGLVPYKVVVTLDPIGAVYKNVDVKFTAKINGKSVVEHKIVKVMISAVQPAESFTYTDTGLAEPSQLAIIATP